MPMEDPDPDLDFVALYGSRSKRRCLEFALVLDAVGIACEVLPDDGRFVLVVRVRDAEAAREQLRLYEDEQRAVPRRLAARLDVYDGLAAACLYGVTVLVFDMLQRNRAFSLDWWDAGLSQAGLVRQGEWWRAVTALALHTDRVHLTGNLAFGLVFVFFAGGILGWGLALSGLVFAGALGNLLNALVQPPEHASVGASTAVFATVGILAAYAWMRRQRPINRWVPLAGGVAFLALLGMGGERTDVFAHVTGLASGGLFGVVYGVLERRGLLLPWHRHALGLAAIVLFVLSWTLALLTHG